MLPPLPELGVMPHDHLGSLVAEDLRGLGNARPRFEQVGRDRVPVQVGDEVPAELELLADAAEAATYRVSVPRPAVLVEEERAGPASVVW